MRSTIVILAFLGSFAAGQRYESDLKHGEDRRRGDRQDTSFDISQWYRGPKGNPQGPHSMYPKDSGHPQPPPTRAQPPAPAQLQPSPYYHPQSGQRSRSIDPWRASFSNSPFYSDKPNYKPLPPPSDDFFNDEYFRQRAVSVNVPKVQKIAPGVMGQVLYSGGSIESFAEKVPPTEERMLASSTERQLLQILGHISSQSETNHRESEKDGAEVESLVTHDNYPDEIFDEQANLSRPLAYDHQELSPEESDHVLTGENKLNETHIEESVEQDVESDEESDDEEEPEADDFFSFDETSSKPPTLQAATGIPPHWTQLPLLPPAKPPAPQRGDFYNVKQHPHDAVHHNAHHRTDHGLSAASVYARIKPHLNGDTLPKKPIPPNPLKRTTTKPHVHEESEEDYYDEDYSDEDHDQTANTSIRTTAISSPPTTEKATTPLEKEEKTVVKEDSSPLDRKNEDVGQLPLAKNFKITVTSEPKTTSPKDKPDNSEVTEGTMKFRKASREGKIVDPESEDDLKTELTSQASASTVDNMGLQSSEAEVLTSAQAPETEQKPEENIKVKEKGEAEEGMLLQTPVLAPIQAKAFETKTEAKTVEIKPGDIKALLKTSEGLSLSEILQKHGLSLPEFLKSGIKRMKIVSIVEAPELTKEEPPSSSTKATTTTSEPSTTQKTEGEPTLKPVFDISQIKPVNLSDLLKNKSDLKKPHDIFAAIFKKMSSTAPPATEKATTTTTEPTTKEPSKWSTKIPTKITEKEQTSTTLHQLETSGIPDGPATTTSLKKKHKTYIPPGKVGGYGVFSGGQESSYGNHRPIHRTRMDEKATKENKTRKYVPDDDSEEVFEIEDSLAESDIIRETTISILIEDEEEPDKTKFINIPSEIRGAIIASSAIGGFALVVFLVIFIILWKRNRKVHAGTRASQFIRRALENASSSANGDSETSSTSETIFNHNMSQRKNGFWGTLGRSVWK